AVRAEIPARSTSHGACPQISTTRSPRFRFPHPSSSFSHISQLLLRDNGVDVATSLGGACSNSVLYYCPNQLEVPFISRRAGVCEKLRLLSGEDSSTFPVLLVSPPTTSQTLGPSMYLPSQNCE
ncbi:unnamed protein product, partial [Musa acuminata subsp. burmannicoides]